jgi:UDP-N-acetylglucosamine 2-epimerase (non-hydrolysing)
VSVARSRVVVFGATRADLFPLGPVLTALGAAPDLDVTLLASGTVGNPDFGDPLADLDLTGVRVEPLAGGLGASGFRAQSDGGAAIARAMGEALDRLRPDAFVVLGDRWELLYAVPPVVLMGVPLVHLHGGEVTEGAIDDRVRHAVSKLADLHCVSTERAAARLRQLGEPADRVVVTGAPSLDRNRSVLPADDARLAAILGHPVVRPLALVTYHPATAGGPEPGAGASDVLAAVAATTGSAIITHPGLDRGREAVLAAIGRAVATAPHLVEVESLGADYLPVLAAADLVVGNSSSGILEAASFGVPVVNVGDRQRGRVSSANVVDAAEGRASVEAAIRRCLAPAFREQARGVVNAYGDGRAAGRIVEVVRRATAGGLARKPFVDLPDRPVGCAEVGRP